MAASTTDAVEDEFAMSRSCASAREATTGRVAAAPPAFCAWAKTCWEGGFEEVARTGLESWGGGTFDAAARTGLESFLGGTFDAAACACFEGCRRGAFKTAACAGFERCEEGVFEAAAWAGLKDCIPNGEGPFCVLNMRVEAGAAVLPLERVLGGRWASARRPFGAVLRVGTLADFFATFLT